MVFGRLLFNIHDCFYKIRSAASLGQGCQEVTQSLPRCFLEAVGNQKLTFGYMLQCSKYKCNTFIVFRKFLPPTRTYLEHHFSVLVLNGYTLFLIYPEILPPTLLFGLILYYKLWTLERLCNRLMRLPTAVRSLKMSGLFYLSLHSKTLKLTIFSRCVHF